MDHVPVYVYVTFVLTLFATIYLFYRATTHSKGFIKLISVWLILQSAIGISGFYTVIDAVPPRFPLFVLPPLVLIIILFATKKGREFVDGLNLRRLIILHVIRLPVEIVLYWLFLANAIPELMTFEGRNFDIIAGLSAPLMYHYGFRDHKINKTMLIGWNVLGLGLLLNIIVNAMLSAPTPFQQFGFEQPNVAVLYFPYILLPACIVPIVLFSHLASMRHLIINK